jgi:Na+-transporting methylmalonyl-CoA/oxaloacetate decarboxylase beta subunit
VTLFLDLAAGSKLSADNFLTTETLGILALGAVAFSIDIAADVLMAKVMSKFSNVNINPLIGETGVSAGTMVVRLVNKVGL